MNKVVVFALGCVGLVSAIGIGCSSKATGTTGTTTGGTTTTSSSTTSTTSTSTTSTSTSTTSTSTSTTSSGTGGGGTGGGGTGGGATVSPACDAPAVPPSKGSCYTIQGGAGGGMAACNPVSGDPCNGGGGEACDGDGNGGYVCYGPPNDAKLCDMCDPANGVFCGNGLTCIGDGTTGQCAKYCCADGDCGSGKCDLTILGDPKVGACVK
jgi:hypothetical protein